MAAKPVAWWFCATSPLLLFIGLKMAESDGRIYL